MTTIISYINNISAQWWNLLMPNSIQLLILFAILLSISYVLRKKSALLQYSLWIVFLVKAFFPFQFQLPSVLAPPINALNYVYPSINASQVTVQNTGIDLSLQSGLFLLWILICLFLLVRVIYKEKQFNKILSNTSKTDLNHLLNPLKINLGIDKDVTVRTGSEVPAPFTKGLWNPVIYLPKQTLGCNSNQIQAILAHELAHIKRKDIIFIYLQNFIDIIYFFHPAVWIGNKEINLHREKICDEIAIHTLEENPSGYGKILLNNLEYLFTNKKKAMISSNLFFSKKSILKRFEYLFNKKEKIMLKLKKSHYFVLLTVFILSIFLACTGLVDNKNKDSQKSTVADNSNHINFDSPPIAEGGFKGIEKNLKYPETIKENGIKDYVLVRTYINKNGKVTNYKIKKGINNELNKAAIEAIKEAQYIPAKKDDESIGAWINIPIIFNYPGEKLHSNNDNSQKQKFVAYDNPPKPIGGFKEIQNNIKYPQIAREAGIEGKVIVRAFINKNGYVENCKIENGIPNTGLNDAAIAALKKTKFTPANQKEKPVGVWISIPIFFRLDE
jgi:TonB family protein